MAKEKGISLNWDDFKKMGNPDNAPEEKDNTMTQKKDHFISKSSIRIHLIKKGKGGKPVSIIRGLEMTNALMKELEKELKSYCGVGGTQKNGEIMIQGDKRDKIMEYLKKKGATDIKKSGG